MLKIIKYFCKLPNPNPNAKPNPNRMRVSYKNVSWSLVQ